MATAKKTTGTRAKKTTRSTTSRSTRSAAKQDGRGLQFEMLMLPYAVIAMAIILAAAAMFVQHKQFRNTLPAETYQAVFLSNGQIYFGQLDTLSRSHMHLSDVYYIQETTTVVEEPVATTELPVDADTVSALGAADEVAVAESTPQTQTGLQVVRVGSEIHQPVNELVLNRDHIIMWQNLSPDSQIIDAITTEKSQRQ